MTAEQRERKIEIDKRHARRLVHDATSLADMGHSDPVTIIRNSNMGRAVINRALAIHRRQENQTACDGCDGSGTMEVYEFHDDGTETFSHDAPCDECDGTGKANTREETNHG